MFKTLLLLIVLALFLEAKTISRTQVIMGTFITISTDEQNKNYIEEAFNIVKAVDLSLSSYNPEATIYKLNRDLFQAGLDKYSYEALQLSQKYYENTDGYFDISVGSITKKLYKFGEDERVPTSNELSNAVVKLKGLHVEKDKAYMEPGMQIDLGGMGKGFAVDKVSEFFRGKGIKNTIISASGDIRCLSTCTLNIQDPFTDKNLARFETVSDDLGITTSGNYNRYVKSVKNNHLIDPKQKKPQNKFVSITLIGDINSADLDAYATASSVMPTKNAYKFLDRIGVGYIVVESDKNLVVSRNISKFTKDLVVNNTMKNKPRYIEYKPQENKKR